MKQELFPVKQSLETSKHENFLCVEHFTICVFPEFHLHWKLVYVGIFRNLLNFF